MDYSEFQDGESTPADLLQRISAKATELWEAQDRLAEAETSVEAAEADVTRISEHELPALLEEARMEAFTTQQGIEVELAEKIYTSIPKQHESAAHRWLEEHQHGDVIKREFRIEFGRGEEVWARRFERDLRRRKQQLRMIRRQAVHPATLTALVKTWLREEVYFPMELFGVFRKRIAKAKLKSNRGP